jgi:hypothetical protein
LIRKILTPPTIWVSGLASSRDAEAAVQALLLRNQTKIAHWLLVKTIGTASSRGFGARVQVEAVV